MKAFKHTEHDMREVIQLFLSIDQRSQAVIDEGRANLRLCFIGLGSPLNGLFTLRRAQSR